MRKTKSRKLSLNKSTVRQLDGEKMKRAAGGSFVCATTLCVSAACASALCVSLNCLPWSFNRDCGSIGADKGCGGDW